CRFPGENLGGLCIIDVFNALFLLFAANVIRTDHGKHGGVDPLNRGSIDGTEIDLGPAVFLRRKNRKSDASETAGIQAERAGCQKPGIARSHDHDRRHHAAKLSWRLDAGSNLGYLPRELHPVYRLGMDAEKRPDLV